MSLLELPVCLLPQLTCCCYQCSVTSQHLSSQCQTLTSHGLALRQPSISSLALPVSVMCLMYCVYLYLPHRAAEAHVKYEKRTSATSLRSSDSKLLFVPRVRTCFASRSFAVAAPTIWNSLWPSALVSPLTVSGANSKLSSITLHSGLLNAPPHPALQIRRVSR